MSSKRKSVQTHIVRETKWGPVMFLKITYTDDRVQYGVSVPGMLSLFHVSRRKEAWDYANSIKVFGLGSVPC